MVESEAFLYRQNFFKSNILKKVNIYYFVNFLDHCGSRKIKYYVSEFKSHYYCGALASQLNMHKNVKRNSKNGLQYFFFFKKTNYVSSESDFFMNIMPKKLQNGADMQNLPQCATTVMDFEFR